jgi:tetratricopeptide (TPR) repeat protein
LPELLEESLLAPSPYEEAEKLEAEGRRYEALLKYQEALRKEPDPVMETHARELERALRREARQMVAQAVEVQNRGEYPKALELYRKSLTIFPLEQVKDYADRLEILLHQGGQSQEARAKAEALWREGAALEKNWRYREALVKYKEGLALSPDPKVEEHVKKLEAFLAGGSN